jgi:hypothetical protein
VQIDIVLIVKRSVVGNITIRIKATIKYIELVFELIRCIAVAVGVTPHVIAHVRAALDINGEDNHNGFLVLSFAGPLLLGKSHGHFSRDFYTTWLYCCTIIRTPFRVSHEVTSLINFINLLNGILRASDFWKHNFCRTVHSA